MEFDIQTPLSDKDIVLSLKKMRDDNIRNSEMVVEMLQRVAFNRPHIFGNEVYNMYEQLIISALDLARFDLVDQCIDILDAKFPDSMRVHKLKGMRFEAVGQFEEAEIQYRQMLEHDSTNSICRKRLVAIKKAQGDFVGARRELCEHVKSFHADFEAWHELSDLYVLDGEYNRALFCIEELILSNAYNHLYYEKVGQIRYSQAIASPNPIDNMEIARKYFAHAVKLSGDGSFNVRALVGMIMSSHHLATKQKCSSRQKKDNVKYAVWAYEMLTKKYKRCSATVIPSSYMGLGVLVESLNINL